MGGKKRKAGQFLEVQSLSGLMLKFVKPPTPSSVEENIAALSQFESEIEVNEKRDSSHANEEQIREDIYEETEELKENDNFGDNHNDEENKSEDSA
ncbi:hypothetical protein CDAR_96301 [Caerostris darwini]|uniref:Uncharacterized protein n=1 Tax=Caerostris darwini TaxID=1538125 RepID=A0AAV4NA21_9ARAC|nr:hypothetical protein CDAR_96301 [Caerostris darwini]